MEFCAFKVGIQSSCVFMALVFVLVGGGGLIVWLCLHGVVCLGFVVVGGLRVVVAVQVLPDKII